MIIQARDNVQKGSANNMVYNGYAVAFVAVFNFILIHILPHSYVNWSFWIWTLMIPSALVDRYIKSKKRNAATFKTHIDGIIGTLWNGFSISVVLLLSIFFILSLAYDTFRFFSATTSFIMILVAIVEFGMAKAYRYKPFFWGAIGFWVGAILCCLVDYVFLKRGDIQFLILAACMILGFVIPGYRLNNLAKENV
jgi:hypothetical protein